VSKNDAMPLKAARDYGVAKSKCFGPHNTYDGTG